MKCIKTIGSILSAFILSACSTYGPSPVIVEHKVSDKMTIKIPEVGVENTVYMGDRMMYSGQGWYIDCLVPEFSLDEKIRLDNVRLVIKQGEEICAKGTGGNVFKPSYNNWLTDSAATTQVPWVLVDKGNGTTDFCYYQYCYNYSNEKYTIKKSLQKSVDDFQQTIEYAGKNGNVLSFTYSEFKDGMARDAFTRNFTVDINEGNVMNYKGAEIKIIEATNTSIKYQILKYFN